MIILSLKVDFQIISRMVTIILLAILLYKGHYMNHEHQLR